MIPPIDDLDRIMDVMTASFDPMYGEAWTRRQVEAALLIGNCHYQLISATGDTPNNEELAAGFWMSRAGFDEEELLLLAVSPQYRRHGLGGKLLESLSLAAGARGAKRLLLEMRRGNDADSLYRGFGFTPIGERPNYYRTLNGERIDAITFSCAIDGPAKSCNG